MTYRDILNIILLYDGKLITIIKDSNVVNDDFILSIQNDLKNEYIIETDTEKIWNLNLNEISKKTIFFIEYEKLEKTKIERERKLRILTTTINSNTIIICSRNYLKTSKTDVHGQSLGYQSSLILLLFKGKLKILKSRYTNILGRLDLKVAVRKLKLKILDKK